jgi:hypothetical protein
MRLFAKMIHFGEINFSMIMDGCHRNTRVLGRHSLFGMNNEGQLGLGDNQPRDVPTLIPGIKAQSIAAGEGDTLMETFDLINRKCQHREKMIWST